MVEYLYINGKTLWAENVRIKTDHQAELRITQPQLRMA